MSLSLLQQIRIVMVNTTHSGNIGAAARAMKNMGVTQLVLVDPIAAVDEEAIQRASRADDILDNVVITETLEEAVADCGLVIGTSARSRHIPWPLMSPRQCSAKARMVANHSPVAIVFGRESRGLTNEELQRCHAHVHIPTDENFSSLNVAQAIQVLCYELRMAFEPTDPESEDTKISQEVSWGVDWDYPMASHREVDGMLSHLEGTLINLGFLDPKTPKQLMPRLRRLYQRALPDTLEINILRGMLAAIDRQIGNRPSSSSEKIDADVGQQNMDRDD